MIRTILCDLLGIEYPIIQAGMGPGDTTPLAIGATNAGALGVVSGGIPKDARSRYDQATDNINKVRAATDRPFGFNVPINMPGAIEIMKACMDARKRDPALARQLRVIIMSAGDSKPYINELKEAGMFTIHVVPTVYHAQRMERLGINAVVASGYEGGGHVNPDPVNTFVLVPAVAEAVKIPVIAAGGCTDAKSLVAALAFGAVGVQMGTRFIATKEATGFHQNVKDALVRASTRDTIVTQGTVGPCRDLKNEYSSILERMVKEGRSQEEIDRYKDEMEIVAIVDGDAERGLIPSGQGVGRIYDIPTCKELIQDRIMKEADQIIGRLAGLAKVT